MIWFVEKEFGFIITEDFPLMKFLNLYEPKHIKRYNDDMEKESNNSKSSIKTFR